MLEPSSDTSPPVDRTSAAALDRLLSADDAVGARAGRLRVVDGVAA